VNEEALAHRGVRGGGGAVAPKERRKTGVLAYFNTLENHAEPRVSCGKVAIEVIRLLFH